MDTTPDTKRLQAEKVEAAIKAAGASVLAIAEATQIPRTTLMRRLAGRQSFTVEDLYNIARALDLPVSALVLTEDELAA